MDITNEKAIKEYILDMEDNYQVIDIFFQNYFKETSSAIFNALYILLKDYNKNKDKIDYILDLLRRFINTNIEYGNNDILDKITGLIIGLKNKIDKNFSKKDKILINNIWYEINDLINSINNCSARKIR